MSLITQQSTGLKHIEMVELDLEKEGWENIVDSLVQRSDVVCSLVPYIYHVQVAKVAIKYGKHFCTTSYVSDGMRALEAEAKSKGVIMLNECGVDPGLDHMSAKMVIDETHSKGGKITSFTSYCGGLPAPDANNNPFGYKLSWSPRGVLLASKNSATFLKHGEIQTIPGAVLFDNYEIIEVPGVGKFECYPNRDSTQYTKILNIPETKTCIRGTFRNLGWCRSLKKLADVGFLNLDAREFPAGMTYGQLTRSLINASATEDLAAALGRFIHLDALPAEHRQHIHTCFQWLGLLDDHLAIKPGTKSILDAVCNLFQDKMQYADGERDMLVMCHTFEIEYPDGKKERHLSIMEDYGIKNGDTSMARTVTLPFAIAVDRILKGLITTPGIIIPVDAEIYKPILEECDKLGIHFKNHVTHL